MKTKLKNLMGGKGLSVIHNSISLLIILAMLFMSFGTIFTLSMQPSEKYEAELEEAVYQLTGNRNTEIDHEVDISFIFFIKAIIAVPKLIDILDARAEIPGEPRNEELDDSTLQFLVFAFALISRFENNEAAENGSNIALVEAIVFVCGMIALLFFSFILVFAIFYAAIRTAFGYISIKKKGRTSQEVLSKSMFPIFKLLPMLVITQLILPELNYGIAIWIIVILALALIAVAVLVSRLIIYDAPDLKYFNAFQGASALGFIGLVFFLMNLMKTALLNVAIVRIIDTAFFVGIPSGNFFNLFYLAFLIVLFITVSCSLRSINRISSKLACISNAKSQVGIGKSVWMLFIIIIPAVMMLFGDSIFYLTTERLTALILTAVGIIIIITAEILLSVFTKKFGQGSSEENRRRIARGTYVFEWIEDTIEEPDFDLVE